MARPWEETWRTNKLDGREVECPDPGLSDDDAYRIAEVYMGSESGFAARVDRAKFIAAAPDMAQALLAFVSDHGHTPDCGYSWHSDHKCSTECAGARAALTKAGVPLS